LMDKQKILWVILSVSIFVVVILVAGIFLLKQNPATQTISPFSDTGTRIYEYGAEKPQSPVVEIPSSGLEVLNFTIGGQTPQEPSEQQPTQLPAPQVPAAGIQISGAPAVTPAAGGAAPPVSQKPSIQTKTNASAAQRAPAPRAPSTPRTVKVVEYWIQTGSYKSQSKAEDLADLLADKGLAGRIFSYTSGGSTFFRVRIGPYTNKEEANKFLGIVKGIQGLEASYISAVAGTRTIN
jgi:cell division septation protein DedD